LKAKGTNWDLLAQNVNGEGGSHREGMGENSSRLDLAEVLPGVLKDL